jgi:hypothetical protein
VANEDSVLEEAMDILKEAGQRIRATQSLMRSEGMTDSENYRDLLTRLSTALAMTEAAYLEARRRCPRSRSGPCPLRHSLSLRCSAVLASQQGLAHTPNAITPQPPRENTATICA